jgi:hypothetical protein
LVIPTQLQRINRRRKNIQYFMQDGATAYTSNFLLATLEEVLSKKLPTVDNSQFVALYISRFECV